ncbi:alpha/beta hydrolase [Cellulomonas sp.]|uniref:alpha/beta fold hydrolase n=1 Tax=Cellulomonas sp. TaxID=40001 RepID=UPI00281261ED|nr:alpha/beta hydrolase [Cellulomonas sp.]
MDTVTADDGRPLALQTLGDGPARPVLVVPGGPCRDPEYLGDLAGAAALRPLVVVHLRGTTATGGLSRGWWRDADDLLAVRRHLGGPAVDVLAHSAGTRAALALVARHPGAVRSLTLVTPSASWLTGAAHDGAELVARRADPVLDAAWASAVGRAREDEEGFQREREEQAALGYARWTEVERAHAQVGATRAASAHAWFRDVPGDAAERVLGADLPPTCVVAGRDDVLSGVAPVRAYAAALRARLVELDRCGHYPWVEQPDAFRIALGRWWATLDEVGPAGLEPTTSAV